jgi:opacity protein-like surface antigen
MRIRRSASAAVAAFCLLLGGAVRADESDGTWRNDDFSRNGYYVAANFAYGIELFDVDPLGIVLAQPTVPFEAQNAYGLNVRFGQRVQKWLGLEIEYEWMNGFEIEGAGLTVATYDPDVVTFNGRFYLPTWRAQPYLLVGGGMVSYDVELTGPFSTFSVSDNGFAFRGGAGVDVYVTRNLVVNVEATALLNTDSFEILAQPAVSDLYYISVTGGLVYRF